MTRQEIIAVIQAAESGRKIQSCLLGTEDWKDDPNPNWNFRWKRFRVKPEPLECWLNVYSDGRLVCFETEGVAKGDLDAHYCCRVAVCMREVQD